MRSGVPNGFRYVSALLSAAAMAFVLHSPSPEPPLTPEEPCLAYASARLWVVDCRSAEPLPFAHERVRELLGVPPCWWTASRRRLQSIPGVGERAAIALIQLRDSGEWPTEHVVDAAEGIGPTTAARVVRSVDTACYGAPIRPGFRRTHRVQ